MEKETLTKQLQDHDSLFWKPTMSLRWLKDTSTNQNPHNSSLVLQQKMVGDKGHIRWENIETIKDTVLTNP